MNKEEIKQYIKDNLKLECETYLNKWYEEFRVITLKLEDEEISQVRLKVGKDFSTDDLDL